LVNVTSRDHFTDRLLDSKSATTYIPFLFLNFPTPKIYFQGSRVCVGLSMPDLAHGNMIAPSPSIPNLFSEH
jgi:hypothetical protein